MVKRASKAATPTGTRELILGAAIQEFAGKGFDGAKVDRIAERAGVNKAMLYYHFNNKAALFIEVLREQFSSVADAVEAVRASGGPPVDQLRRFTEAIAKQALARPHFPHMWLREIADGGRHVDASVISQFRRVLGTLAAILADGEKAGVFRKADPFVVQISLVAPLMFFAASAPLRERATQLVPPAPPLPGIDAVIEHVQAATLSVLTSSPSSRRPSR